MKERHLVTALALVLVAGVILTFALAPAVLFVPVVLLLSPVTMLIAATLVVVFAFAVLFPLIALFGVNAPTRSRVKKLVVGLACEAVIIGLAIWMGPMKPESKEPPPRVCAPKAAPTAIGRTCQLPRPDDAGIAVRGDCPEGYLCIRSENPQGSATCALMCAGYCDCPAQQWCTDGHCNQ